MSDFSGAVMTGRSSRIEQFKAQARSPGEASFFYSDHHFKYDAVKVLPGEYFVASEDILITTVLGSCIAACIWDGRALGLGDRLVLVKDQLLELRQLVVRLWFHAIGARVPGEGARLLCREWCRGNEEDEAIPIGELLVERH